MRREATLWLAVVVLSLALVSPCWAIVSSTLRGKVVDSEGQPVPDVTIVLRGERGERRVRTNKRGVFKHRFLDMGTYEWSVEAPGMKVYSVRLLVKGPTGLALLDDTVLIQKDQVLPSLGVRPDHQLRCELVLVKEGYFEQRARQVELGKARKLILQAEKALAGKDFELARARIRKALDKDPGTAYAQYVLGVIEYDSGRPDAASAAFTKALELDPNTPSCAYYLGKIAYDAGKIEESIRWFEQELALSPDLPDLYQNLGVLYRDRGDLARAAEMFEGLITLRPDDVDAYAELVALYEKLGDSARLEAVLAAREKLGVKDAAAYYNLGAKYWKAKQWQQAAEAFRKALAQDETLAAAHKGLGYCLVKEEKLPEAREHLQRYLELSPDAPDAAEIREVIQQIDELQGS